MRLLIVCSYRDFRPDGINQFIKEQVNALVTLTDKSEELRVESEYYLVRGKGVKGYLKEIPKLRKIIREYKPDAIHAHYGLCGLLANMATRRVPVVTTYHGSDINDPDSRKFSLWSMRLSAWNIFVSQRTMDMVHGAERKNCTLIPCGVDLTEDQLVTREDARKELGWIAKRREPRAERKKRYVLFAGMFEYIKDPELAMAAVEELRAESQEVELIELRGYTREEVNRLMCAVDCLLMTSKTEGSPQVIKEAMACGCPIVSVDVGDVKERISGIAGCYLVKSREPRDVAEALKKAFEFKGKTKGREKIIAEGLNNELIAHKLIDIYERVKR